MLMSPVSERVMMSHYVEEGDPELREASNRIYDRLLASLPPDVAKQYGCLAPAAATLEVQLGSAMTARDWKLVAEISTKMARPDGA